MDNKIRDKLNVSVDVVDLKQEKAIEIHFRTGVDVLAYVSSQGARALANSLLASADKLDGTNRGPAS